MTGAFLRKGLFIWGKLIRITFHLSLNNFNFVAYNSTTLPRRLTTIKPMIKTHLKALLFIFLIASGFTARSGEISKLVNQYSGQNKFQKADQSIFSSVQSVSLELNNTVSAFKLLKPTETQLKKIVAEKPKFLRLKLPDPNSNGTITVLLYEKEIYTSNFKITVSDNSIAVPAKAVNYRGMIENKNNSFAAISIYENEVMGLICDERGNFNLGKLKNDNQNTHIFYNDKDLTATNPFVCGTTEDIKKLKNNNRIGGNNNTSSVNCANLSWETDQDIYTDKGSIGLVSTYINGLFNQVSTLYNNDGITVNLESLFIWNTVDPYIGPSSGDYLDQFGTNRTSFTGDLAHLIGYGGGGGVAWLDVLCDGSTSYRMGYSGISANYNSVPTYSWTVEVVSHEQGHNFGSEHTHDCVWNGNNTAIDGCGPASGYPSSPGGCAQAVIPVKGTIMSYCHLSGGNGINLALGFGPQPLALILSRINTSSCLTPCSAPGIANDDPCSATVLTVGTSCSATVSNNTGATNSSVPATLCDGNGDGDVWFSAVVPASGKLYINSFAGDLTDMGMAVYTGTCSSLTLFNCYAGGNSTTPSMPYAQIVSGLTPSATVWIRMWDVGNDDFGAFSICATDPCNLTTTITGPTTACASTNPQLCATVGASAYLWSTSATTQCINPSSSGSYTVTVSDAIGCTATDSHTITVYTNPTALVTGPTTGCTGNTVQICGNAGASSYLWSTGATTQCINSASTNSYTVTITDANGCTSSDSHTVTFGSSISVAITGPATMCSGSGTQICGDAGFSTYLWSNGATTQCISPASTGTYTVSVSDAGGCTATNSKAVTVNTAAAMSVTGPASGCANSFPQLCAAGGYSSYAWSSGETTQCLAPLTTGSYIVTGTDANGCTSSSSHSITILPNPTASITGSSIACPGTTVQLCAVTSGGTFLWSNGATISCINVVDSGNYVVTVTGGNGCTSTASHVLSSYAITPAVITGPTNVCFGSVAQLCAPSGFTTYLWSSGETTQCISKSIDGTYIVQLTDANGCTGSASHTLTVGASLNLTITGPAGVCPGQTAQLCASAAGTTLWSNGSTAQCISPTTSGTYTVTVTDGSGCTGSASKVFTAYPAFSAAITGPSTACFNSNPQLCAPSGTNYQYLWSNGQTTRCINANTSGIYSVTVTNANGCTATGSKGLTIFSQLNATISGPNSLCLGAVGQLCAPTGSALYQWSTGNTTRCINVNSSGTYTVTITDGNGCTASSSLPVTFSSSITTVISGTHAPCPGVPLELCVPSGYVDYTWNTGETTECISVNSNGNYSVTIHDAVGCVGNDTHVVVFNSLPPVLIAGQTELCQGEVGILCATSGYTSYLWNDSTDQSCISVDTAGTYSVTITDAAGCTNSTSIPVNLTDINPEINYSAPDLIATPTGLQYLYSWTYNGVPFGGTTNTITPDHTGFYTVVITDQISGCIDSVSYYQFMVGVNDISATEQIRIYPNPISSELLNIAFDFAGTEKISVQVMDALGQILVQDIFVKAGILIKQVRVSDLAAGIYLVNIKGENWRKTWKVVKQ